MKKGEGAIIGEDFRRLQLLELDMLVELDRICRKYGIKYCMTCGTLLGAVRHKGFIPWDDDADVSMWREDYEKFKSVSHELNPDICWFQDHDTDPDYFWGYGKLRRTGTTYIRPGQEKQKFKTGVYIDIMPCDDMPKSVVGQMWVDFYCFILRKILWSNIGKDAEKVWWKRQVYKVLSKINVSRVFRKLDKMAKKSRNDSTNYVRCLMLPCGGKERFLYEGKKNAISLRYGSPKEWSRELIEMEFEGHMLFAPKEYDAYLKSRYGNYMLLPAEKERVAKAPASLWEF